jgi:hypothetical protein
MGNVHCRSISARESEARRCCVTFLSDLFNANILPSRTLTLSIAPSIPEIQAVSLSGAEVSVMGDVILFLDRVTRHMEGVMVVT